MIHLKKSLTDFHCSVYACLEECQETDLGPELSSEGVCDYISMMTHLVNVVKCLYLFAKSTSGQTPYLPGGGQEVVDMLRKTRELGITILSHHVPQRFKNTTECTSAFFCPKEAENNRHLPGEILQYLEQRQHSQRIQELDELVKMEIDREFQRWIDSLFGIATYLQNKIAHPTDDELMKACNLRAYVFIESVRDKLDFKIKQLTLGSPAALKTSLEERLNHYLNDNDPLWREIVRVAFDAQKREFCNYDISCMVFKHWHNILIDGTYDFHAYCNLYICTKLLQELNRLEYPTPAPSADRFKPVPADLSDLPNMNLFLQDWIKQDRELVRLLREGTRRAYEYLKPGRNYRCSWAHLFRLLIEMKVIKDTMSMNDQDIAETLIEIISSEDANFPNVDTIRKQIGANDDVICSSTLIKTRSHQNHLQELAKCYDNRLMSKFGK